jgi:hypothetical protein
MEERRQQAKYDYAASEEESNRESRRERARYAKECEAREAEAAHPNRELDELIANLGNGTGMPFRRRIATNTGSPEGNRIRLQLSAT